MEYSADLCKTLYVGHRENGASMSYYLIASTGQVRVMEVRQAEQHQGCRRRNRSASSSDTDQS